MRIAVPQETAPGERRVALVPESCKKLVQAGYEVSVEADAGRDAGYPDAAYREVGATVETDRAALVSGADILLKVGRPAGSGRARSISARSCRSGISPRSGRSPRGRSPLSPPTRSPGPPGRNRWTP